MDHDPKIELAEFARSHDEAAFQRVVTAFGSLVLDAARRRTNDPQMAEEVAQNVFAIMARKAERLSKHRTIAGWVFTTTRLESAKALRGRQRHRRKLQAFAKEIDHQTDMSEEEQENWRDALPHLEAGIDRLQDAERQALLARFFENKSFRQIAATTGGSEAACRMRVHRSIEKLRGWMAQRGVTLSAAALSTGLAAEWAPTASAATIGSISSNALAAAPALGTGTILTNSIMTMNSTKSACLAFVAVLAVGIVPLALQGAKANRLEQEIARLQVQPATNRAQRPALTALTQTGQPSPAQRIQREAALPHHAEALANALVDAIAEQNMGAVMRAMVTLSRMDRAQIDELLTQIQASNVSLGIKQAAARMLIGFMDINEEDGAALLDKAITIDVQLFHMLGNRLARWAESNPSAAAAWWQEHRDDEQLKKSTGSNRIGDLILEAILPGMARTDPDLAIAQLDELDPRAQWSTLAAVAGSIIARNAEGDFERARQVLMRLEPDRRRSGISVASEQRMNSVNEFDSIVNLARTLDLTAKQIAGMGYWMATTQTDLPIRERADWVLANLGDQNPSSLRNFIWNSRQREPGLATWIAELPTGSFKDQALRGEVSALAQNLHEGGEAILRARQISDDELRSEALRYVVEKDPQAAEQVPPPATPKEAEELAAALAAPRPQSANPAPATTAR